MAILKELLNFRSQLFNNSSVFSLLFMTNLLLFAVVLLASVDSIDFNYTRFDANLHDILLEKDANLINGQIILTTLGRSEKNRSFGRATYAKPLHLWEKASRKLTNFSTHFSFIINGHHLGDGIAFFLAPNGSRIPPDATGPGGLGLVRNDADATNPEHNNCFVAVEFDTYHNPWDPPGYHVGININSMKSVVNVSWQKDIEVLNNTEAWIAYDSSQKVLSVHTYTVIESNLSFVVDLAKFLPEWVTFGFSSSTGTANFEENSIQSWEFNSSSEIHESQSILYSSEKKPIFFKVVVGLIVAVCAFVIGIGFILLAVRRTKEKGRKPYDPRFSVSFEDEFKDGTGPRKFSYDDLAVATNDFSEEENLGEGGCGRVYRGFLKDLNCYVAIKRVSRGSEHGHKEFVAEFKIISRLKHRNLVKLMGWCQEKDLLLAYEFLPNGSLDSYLFKGKSTLSWTLRYKIAEGLATALLYLHEEGDQCVLHRDIKPSNIMLDSDFNAKLGDFGLARLVDHAKGWRTTVLAGTMGYMAPECLKSGKATKESDIYSFGIVCLEIACGRRVFETWTEENQATIVEWVWKLYGMGQVIQAADPKLHRDFDAKQVERLMVVGLWCVHPDPTFRPAIRQVTDILLNAEAPLPTIPLDLPVLAYIFPQEKLPINPKHS